MSRKRDSKKNMEIIQSLGLSDNLPEIGSFPLHDTEGMGCAIYMLIRSLY